MTHQEEFLTRLSKLSPAQKALFETWKNNKSGHQPEKVAIPKRMATDFLPLSFAQQRMWFENQLDTSSLRYNIFVAFRLNGPLNIPAMKQTIHEILDRHEILRTYFPFEAGRPLQVIISTNSFMDVAFVFSDLSALPEEGEKYNTVLQILNKEAQRPFNLAKDFLIRIHLLQVSKEEYIFFYVAHHVIMDARATDIFLHEISVLYKAHSLNQTSPLSPLPIQYADFALWQRNRFQGQFLQQELDYWRQHLADAAPFLDLPTDYPRPRKQTFKGALYSFRLPPTLIDPLKQLSQQEGTTLFMTLLAAFQVLLYRCTNQRDILVGVPVTDRTYVETNDLIGFFLNTLVIRTTLSDLSSFRKLLSHVRNVVLETFAHQELPFEQVVETLHPTRDTGYHPLFQVMFAMQDISSSSPQLEGLTATPIHVGRKEVTSDLALYIQIGLEEIKCIWEYRIDLFTAQTVQFIGERFQTLLESIVRNPDQSVAELPLLSCSEKQKLLIDWNSTQANFSHEEAVQTLFEAQVRRTPDALAVAYEGQFLSYAALNNRANQLAYYLQSRGLSSNSPVGICLPRSIDQFIAILGILKSGGCCIPLDLSLPKARLSFMVTNAHLSFLITYNHLTSLFIETSTQFVILDDEYDRIIQEQCTNPVTTKTSEHLCYTIYTSGSTGNPKGVLIPHRTLTNLIYYYNKNISHTQPFRTIQFSPLTFDVSFLEIFITWVEGGTLINVSEEVKHDADRLFYYLIEEKIERICLPFVALQQLAEVALAKTQDHLPLKEITSTGEQLRITLEIRSLFKRMEECVLRNFYGPSETHGVTFFTLKSNSDTWDLLPPIGSPIANSQIYLLDKYMQLVPVGTQGELYIGGHSLGLGYLNAPHLTAESFLPNPFTQEPGARLYKTGDRCRYLHDGSIEYLGRLDRQVKIRGFRIELGEIEAVLDQHPHVNHSAVNLQEDASGRKYLVAYLVVQKNQNREPFPLLTQPLLQAYLQEKLPEHMIPSAIVYLEAFPLTASGKVNYKSLPLTNALTLFEKKPSTQPLTFVESLLTMMWSEILGLQEVDIYDNFFDLGGHSLLATQLIARIRAVFKIDLPLRELFERPTIANLSKQIDLYLSMQAGIERSPIQHAVSEHVYMPLSFAQQRMWLINQLGLKSQYNVQFAFRLEGKFHKKAFISAITRIIERHDILRTCFPLKGDHPVQVVEPMKPSHLFFTYYDLRLLTQEQQDKELALLTINESKHIFNLEECPFLRFHLVQIESECYIFSLLTHHIIFDGWSMAIFFRELSSLYSRFSQNLPSTLLPPTIQYADYARWQRDWLQGKVLESELAYWKECLADVPPLLNLPTDRPRPSVQTFNGDTHNFLIPVRLSEQIKALSKEQGVTLFMFLLTTFQILLARYSGQEDILVGVPIANRTYVETEALIGCFINTLVIRTNLSGAPPFKALLAHVREISLQAYMHQDIPFDYLVENLQIKREASHNPLFQVMFSLQNTPQLSSILSEMTIEPLELAYTTPKFDLTLAMGENSEGIAGVFEYNTDLFDKQTIERMEGHFRTLLEEIVSDPERRISELTMLTQTERQTLLKTWNTTSKAWSQESTVSILFEEQVMHTPDAPAIVYANTHITYQLLDCRANQLSHHFIEHGVGPETLVGVYLERSIDLIATLLGILKAGGAYVLLDPSDPQERVCYFLNETDIRIIITYTKYRTKITCCNLCSILCLDADWDRIQLASSKKPEYYVSPDNICYVVYTPGPTGRPRGVSIQHRGVTNLIAWHQHTYDLTETTRATQLADLAFDTIGWEIWPYLTAGASIHLPHQEILATPERLVEWISLSGCTHTFMPVPVAQFAFTRPWLTRTALRYLLTDGDKLHYPVGRTQEYQCISHYGHKESTTIATCMVVDLAGDESGGPSIGYPISNTQIYILDSFLQPVPVGIVGELCIGGPGIARGYVNLPDLTAERFTPNPFDITGGSRLYRTGDRARLCYNGAIELVGRADRQMKIQGFRIEPGEIEAVIKQHPLVHQTVVTLQAESISGEKPICAFVVPREGTTITIDELHLYASARLPVYMLPSYVILQTLPLTVKGNVDLSALSQRGKMKDPPEVVSVAPRTETEQILLHIWQQVLRTEHVSIHDNFFDSGGYSFLLVQIHQKLKEIFKRDVNILDLFLYPTVASFAAYISEGQETPSNFAPELARANKRSMKMQQQREISVIRRKQYNTRENKGSSKNDAYDPTS